MRNHVKKSIILLFLLIFCGTFFLSCDNPFFGRRGSEEPPPYQPGEWIDYHSPPRGTPDQIVTRYTVTFEPFGRGPAPDSPQQIAYRSFIPEPLAMIDDIEGHGFGGWWTKDGRLNDDWGEQWNFATDFVTGNVDLYALWDFPFFTVHFYRNDGSSDFILKRFYQDTKAVEPTIARTGYYINGWYTEAALTTRWNFETTRAANQDLNLYARWVLDRSSEGLVWVPGGNFMMGTPSGGNANERPVHPVIVSGFYMSETLVTQEEYTRIMLTRPTDLRHSTDQRAPEYIIPPLTPSTEQIYDHRLNPSIFGGLDLVISEETKRQLPVERVSWFDAVLFCNLLSDDIGLDPVYTITINSWGLVANTSNIWSISDATVTADFTKNGFRLPTESEWEYAARGGNGSPDGFIFAGSDNADEVAWFYDNSGGRTHRVGHTGSQKLPNSLGLYDMSGNIYEWCWDWFGSYPSASLPPETDPTGPDSGTQRVRRGGCWSNVANNVRNNSRNSFPPTNNTYVMGIRVVRNP